jgi:hypothetical protein
MLSKLNLRGVSFHSTILLQPVTLTVYSEQPLAARKAFQDSWKMGLPELDGWNAGYQYRGSDERLGNDLSRS